jgi:hypothetical protein
MPGSKQADAGMRVVPWASSLASDRPESERGYRDVTLSIDEPSFRLRSLTSETSGEPIWHGNQEEACFATGDNASCIDARATQCSGSLDIFSLVLDWRFAKRMDVHACVAWSQARNGLASSLLQANGMQAGGTIVGGPNKASTYDPGVGLRYQP